MKKLISLALAAVLALGILSGCGKKADAAIQIAVPNDTTNEARALLLLEANGIIKLKDGAGITATKNDIAENPHNVEIVETEAAQIPNILKDVDYAVINSNYAINAGLNPRILWPLKAPPPLTPTSSLSRKATSPATRSRLWSPRSRASRSPITSPRSMTVRS